MTFPVAGVRAGKEDDGGVLPADVPGAPPFKGHRWLPLPGGPDKDQELWRTPMAETTYDPNGPDWGSWSLGAQAHYSLFENLEKGNLELYHYGHGIDEEREGIWNMAYDRMNINFMAIWGEDVLDNLPFDSPDDELALSVGVNKKLKRRMYIFHSLLAASWYANNDETSSLSKYPRNCCTFQFSITARDVRYRYTGSVSGLCK